MLRLIALTLACSWLLGCGPDRPKCTGPHPDFRVVLKLSDRPLPADAVVRVTYGGSGMENYVLASPTVPEVVFCSPAGADGGAIDLSAAGASGADDSPVEELQCQLWTGGFASLSVTGTGLDGMSHDLTPKDDQCTVTQTIVLDSPDGG